MAEKKLGIEFKPGTGWATAWAAAPAALAGFQAAAAQRQLGEVRTNIENYRRQDIENPFANLSNPYENLAVATQAAEMQMEQTDQALANTLDTLRETGAAAGGATAIANAALKSKQGISASIEKQEAQNQRLQAQGQLQVDIAKGKGETIRMEAQELRDINELNRLQSQSDMAQYTRDSAMQTGMEALGAAAGVRNAGIVLEQKDQKDAPKAPGSSANTSNIDIKKGDFNPFPESESGNMTNNFKRGIYEVPGTNLKKQAPTVLNNPTANNLYDFYNQSGNSTGLPSVSDRGSVYESAGLGPASSYKGDELQNDKLLEYLQGADLATLSGFGINLQ